MKSTHHIARAALVAVWLALGSPVVQAQTPPTQNGGSPSSEGANEAKALQGSRVKHDTDLFTGSFVSTIPIEAAPARNGTEPHLMLTYSSSGENGWCGVGWSLEIGYIERYTRDGIPVKWDNATVPSPSPSSGYDDAKGFRFSLFGKEGRLLHVTGNEYRAEIEGSFVRFFFGSDTWDVYDKGGNHYQFGRADNSRMKNTKVGWATGSAATFRWALDQIVTVTGDLTTISYLTYGSEKMLYPDTISYNGHQSNNGYTASLGPTHTVQFVTEARNDKSFSYRSAFRVEQNRRLKRIYCKVGSQVVRRYELTYKASYSPSTKRSLLEQVQVFGSNDSSVLPPQTFSYSDKPFQFQPALVSWLDMNVPNIHEYWWETVTGNDGYDPVALAADLIDIDGDGLPDRVLRNRFSPFNNFSVQRNLNIQPGGAGSFATAINWGPTSSQNSTLDPEWSAINSGFTRFLDIDGDGRPDRVMDYKACYTVPGTDYDRFVIERNTGTGFSPVTWGPPSTTIDHQGAYNSGGFKAVEGPTCVKMIDIDGDGHPDRVMTKVDSPYEYLIVQLGTGSGFLPPRRFGPYSSQGRSCYFIWGAVESTDVKFVDINGDGLPDRVMLPILDPASPCNNEQTVYPANLTKFVVEFGNGHSFEQGDWPGVDPQYNAVSPNGQNLSGGLFALVESLPYVGLFDINGDHLPDRVMFNYHDHSQWLVQINNGSGFELAVPFSNILLPPGAPDEPAWYGINGDFSGNMLTALSDINGDGLVDRVMADYNAINDLGGAITGFRVSLNSGPVPDLMIGANNGIGGSTSVQYEPSTTWDNRKDTANPDSPRLLPFVVQTASSVSVSDGINPARTTTYGYGGGFFDASRREFAGFACVTNTDPSNRMKVYYFHQGGGRDNAANGEYADEGSFAKRGMPYRIETYGNDSPTPLLYNVVVNQVDQADLTSGRWFPFVKQSFEFDYPGGGTPNATATKFVYDTSNCNLTKKVVYGKVTGVNLSAFTFTDDNPADTQYHQISYGTISGNSYILDHPSNLSLTSDDAGTQVVQETKYTYNSNSGTLSTEERRICSGQYSLESHQYDSFGVRNLLTDATGVQTFIESLDTTYHIYPSSTRQRVTANVNSAADHITSSTYDARSGLLTAATDVMGIQMQNSYDEFFRLTETDKGTSPGAGLTLWVKKVTYNLGGVSTGTSANYVRLRVNDGVDSVNGIETWAYADGLGRVIETRTEAEVSGQFRVVNTAYDERGEAFLTTWPRLLSGSGYTIPSGTLAASFTGFDPAGRISQTRARVDATLNSAGVYQSKTDSTGDANSPLAAKTWSYVNGTDPWWIVCTDEDSKVRRYQLDGFGRTNVIQEVDGGSTYTTTHHYDLAGNRTEIINHNSEHIYYGYDDAGNLVASADPHLGVWTYKRDKAGRLREQTDGKGQKVALTYNAPLSRLDTKKVYDAGGQLVSTATYTYDSSGDPNYTVYKGMLYMVTDSEGWEKNGYDTRGRLQKTTRHLSVNNQDYTTTYGYNDGDKITSTAYPNAGPTINYEYHPSGATYRVSRAGPYYFYTANAANFDEFGHVTQFSYGNGKVNNRIYFAVSKRLQTISTSGVLSKDYHYSAGDDVTYISGTSITYDNLHRVKTYTGLSGSYAYDAVGNITSSIESGAASAYGYGAARKQAVKTAYGKTYLYDLCGNMIVRGQQALEYDAENHLIQLGQPGGLVVEYGYAANGARLWKRKNQTDLQVWIGSTYEEKGLKTLFHVFAGSQRICTFEPGSALAVNGGGDAATHVGYYYHQDHLNSSSALSGSSGQQLEVNVWYPFGRTQTATPQASFQVSSRFTGQILDAETGLYYYGARYYDPELGRFIQPDTIIPDLGNPQSYNRYTYALNNPLRYIDPSGHDNESFYGYPGYSLVYNNNMPNIRAELAPIYREIFHGSTPSLSTQGSALLYRSLPAYTELVFTGNYAVNIRYLGTHASAQAYFTAVRMGVEQVGGAFTEPFQLIDAFNPRLSPDQRHEAFGRGALATAMLLLPLKSGGIAAETAGLETRGLRPLPGTRQIPGGIPDSWRIRPTQGEGGTWYYDPANKGNAVRVMQGDPASPFPNSQSPYVRWQQNGQALDIKGNVVPKNTPDAHIPLQDFKFNPDLFK